MDGISSIAAMSTSLHAARMDAEIAIRTLKMAQDQQTAVLELILKTMQMTVTGTGQNIDVTV
jgi:Putative motility protein